MTRKRRHTFGASGGSPGALPSAPSALSAASRFTMPPAAARIAGAVIVCLALLQFTAGMRVVMSQHYAAEAQRAMQAGNKWPQAESNALKAIQFFPSNGFAHHMLGATLRITGRQPDARRHYRLALGTTAHPGATLHGLGESALLQGDPALATQAISDFERGLTMWPRPNPEPAYVWYEAGGLAVNNAMPARAIYFMTRSQNQSGKQEYDIAVAKAEAFDRLGFASTAALYLMRQMLLDPGSAPAAQYLLQMCRRAKDFEDGRFALGAALAVYPKSAALHNAAAALEFMAGDLERAEASARRALALQHALVAPNYFLGEILYKRGQWAEARSHFEKYLAGGGPDDPQARLVQDRLNDIARRLTP